MADGVYRVTEVIGTSSESWEAAARSAVETAAKTVRDLRIAEVLRQDVQANDSLVFETERWRMHDCHRADSSAAEKRAHAAADRALVRTDFGRSRGVAFPAVLG